MVKGSWYCIVIGVILLLSTFGCTEQSDEPAKLKIRNVTDSTEMTMLIERAQVASSARNYSFNRGIKYENDAIHLAYFYLKYAYSRIQGSSSFIYGIGLLEWNDLTAELIEGVWQIYHKNKEVMQIRQSDGAILSMSGLGKNAKQKRLVQKGFVHSAELAVRRVYGKETKGRDYFTYEVFSCYSETEQDIIWYVRVIDETVFSFFPLVDGSRLIEEGWVEIVPPRYFIIRQTDGVILGHNTYQSVMVENLLPSDVESMTYWEVLAWQEEQNANILYHDDDGLASLSS